MDNSARAWREIYAGGSPEAERGINDALASDMVAIQAAIAQKTGRKGQRTLHARIIAGFDAAKLVVDDNIPAALAQGHFQPGAVLPALLRFSNASSLHQADAVPDMRGIAVRLDLGNGQGHDLLATNFPVSHARNASQFVKVAQIANGARLLILPRFLMAFGLGETLRIVRNVRAGARRVASIATEQFWSRGAILWGDAGPVRFTFRPEAQAGATGGMADLTGEVSDRLTRGDIRFRFCLQLYVDEDTTPIEDGAVEWQEKDAPMVPIATLIIPQGSGGPAASAKIDTLSFTPWNAPAEFRPLGNLNRARGPVYAASTRHWQARG